MAKVKKKIGHGASHLDDLNDVLNGIIDDLAAIRSAIVATHAKLDADGGVTDQDYATNDPAALVTTKE